MSAQGTLRDGQPAGFGLIETLRWEPKSGFLRLDLHLRRLSGSAAALDFDVDPDTVRSALDEAVAGRSTPLRVRLLLAGDGACEVTTQPFADLAADTVWKIAIAQTRLDSADPLLRHKTTRRERYDRARSEIPKDAADEVLLLNERGELCEGSFTTLFVRRGGIWLTPALSCGLLAGVLRADMLDQGLAHEARLTPDDLAGAEIAVGNSLRGLIPAVLV